MTRNYAEKESCSLLNVMERQSSLGSRIMQVGYLLRCYFSVPVQWCAKLNEGRYIYGSVRLFLVGFCMGHHSIALASSGGVPDIVLVYLFLPALIVIAALAKRWFLSVPVAAGILHYFFVYLFFFHKSTDSLFYDYHNYIAYTSPILLVIQIVGVIVLFFQQKFDN